MDESGDPTRPLRRLSEVIDGLLLEAKAAVAKAERYKRDRLMFDAATEAGKATGLTRALEVLLRLRTELEA